MIWSDAGRIACLLALWAGLALLRGPTCPWGWGMAAEGLAVVVAAWFAADEIPGQFLKGQKPTDRWEMGQRLGRVALAVAVALVLAWGVAGVAMCRGRA